LCAGCSNVSQAYVYLEDLDGDDGNGNVLVNARFRDRDNRASGETARMPTQYRRETQNAGHKVN